VAEIEIQGLEAGPWRLKSYMRDIDLGAVVVKGPELGLTIKTP